MQIESVPFLVWDNLLYKMKSKFDLLQIPVLQLFITNF